MNTPTVGQTLYVRSTSNNDKAGWPGVTSVRITYLDAAGDQQTSDVSTNGTTQVSIGTGFSFIQYMESLTATGAEVAAGDITVSSTNGVATVATTFEKIAAGGNRSLSGRYTVPTGYHALIVDWAAAAVGGASQDTRIRADYTENGEVTAGIFHFKDRAFLADQTNIAQPQHFRRIPAGSIVKVSSVPSATGAGNKLDTSFDLVIMPD